MLSLGSDDDSTSSCSLNGIVVPCGQARAFPVEAGWNKISLSFDSGVNSVSSASLVIVRPTDGELPTASSVHHS